MQYSKNRILTIAAMSFLTFLLSHPFTVWACDCDGPHGLVALRGADAVFSGKVANIKYLDEPEQANPEPRIIVTFDVYRTWKGPLKKRMALHTVLNKWTCKGYIFREGEEYLVYARKNEPSMARMFPKGRKTLGVSLCGGTIPLFKAQKDLQELGAGKASM